MVTAMPCSLGSGYVPVRKSLLKKQMCEKGDGCMWLNSFLPKILKWQISIQTKTPTWTMYPNYWEPYSYESARSRHPRNHARIAKHRLSEPCNNVECPWRIASHVACGVSKGSHPHYIFIGQLSTQHHKQLCTQHVQGKTNVITCFPNRFPNIYMWQ